MSSQGRRVAPDMVRDELPALDPSAGGSYELTRDASQEVRRDVTAQMSNAVAQDLAADASSDSPEGDAMGQLAASVGGSQSAAPPSDPSNPEAREKAAAQQLAQASGGDKLPGDVLAQAEAELGTSLSHVEVFKDEPAVEDVDAGGAAVGNKVFLAPGKFDPASPQGKGLLYEELAHAANAGPVSQGGDLTLAGTQSPTESAAGNVNQAAQGGGDIASSDVAGAAAPANTIQRGEAGVHQNDLTMPGMGVEASHLMSRDNPNQPGSDGDGWRHRDSENLSPDQRAALQVYAGNFMSDLSQANVPMLINILQNVPTSRGDSGRIGPEGAGVLAQAVITAFAILDVGTEAAALVTAQTTEVYEAERHIDNPMGTSFGTYSVLNDDGVMSGVSQPELPPVQAVETREPTGGGPSSQQAPTGASGAAALRHGGDDAVGPADPTLIAATQEQHAGSAVQGLQFANPTLFQISDAGLANHIYNSTEASKQSYKRALQHGPTPAGRMHTGYADHIIQDYYSHSNFIEVALNSYISSALAEGHGGGEVHEETHHHAYEGDQAQGALSHVEEHTGDLGPDASAIAEAVDEAGGSHTRLAPQDREQFFSAMARSEQGQEFLADQRRRDRGEAGDMVTPVFVSTLYDDVDPETGERTTARSESGRQAITTGTFGGTDTQISIAHTFMPLIPQLHASMMSGIETFLGLIETAPPSSNWDGLKAMLLSGGRDGAVLGTLLDALGSVCTVELPNGLEMNYTELQISPGWFGDPWTVDVPDITDPVDVTYADVPITAGLALFINLGRRIEQLKRGVARFARWIGIAQIAEAIEAAWDDLKDLVMRRIQDELHRFVMEMITKIIEELRGEPLTLEEAANIASGGLGVALSMADEAMHHAEGRTSMEYRLTDEGGDLYEMAHANDADASRGDANGDGTVTEDERTAWIAQQRQELERNVGPLRGSGTRDDPWMPLAPLPPSHSEIGKDHPPHNPEHHEHEEAHPDFNPEILNPTSAPADRIRTQDDDQERFHEVDARNRSTQRRLQEGRDTGGHGGHDEEAGSAFFGVGVALAREAQKHMYKQLERAWSELWGGERHMADLTEDDMSVTAEASEAGAASSRRRDASMEVGHDEMVNQARRHAERERERNQERGFQRAQEQADVQQLAARAPAVTDLMNLVDLYLAHPDDSTWWSTVMDNYVEAHADEVYQHILRRNNTRSYRPGEHGHDDDHDHDH